MYNSHATKWKRLVEFKHLTGTMILIICWTVFYFLYDLYFTVVVLPKFEVMVDAPSFFYYNDSVLTINIVAKYVVFC